MKVFYVQTTIFAVVITSNWYSIQIKFFFMISTSNYIADEIIQDIIDHIINAFGAFVVVVKWPILWRILIIEDLDVFIESNSFLLFGFLKRNKIMLIDLNIIPTIKLYVLSPVFQYLETSF